MLDPNKIREEYPLLQRTVGGHPLVYFDNAATSLTPQTVIDAVDEYYLKYNANIHRAVHTLCEEATAAYERARIKVQEFIGAGAKEEIIFTGGTTMSVNLVASSFGDAFLKEGDEIIISQMEHHSNIVPWQMMAHAHKCKLKIIPMKTDGTLDLEAFKKIIGPKTKFIAVVHVSNSLGTINPVKKIVEIAHKNNVPVLIDGAQAVGKIPVNVRDLDCDFYAFSGHKMFGPTGIGVLYGKKNYLEMMPPYEGGGDMIASVTFEKTTYNVLPYKFEAGTKNIAGAIGLGAAIDYIHSIGIDEIFVHEQILLQKATELLQDINGLKIIGTAPEKIAVVSFTLEGIHPHDVGTLMDQDGIAIRTGHHCTQPVMQFYGIPATSRISMSVYNTAAEIERAVESIKKIQKVFV